MVLTHLFISFLLVWTFIKKKNKTSIFLNHHHLVSVTAYISINQQKCENACMQSPSLPLIRYKELNLSDPQFLLLENRPTYTISFLRYLG